MVHVVGLRLLVVLAVVHQNAKVNGQVAYSNVEQSSYSQNVKLSSYGHQVEQPDTTETRVIKHPDEKIVHRPAQIYVKRPPTYVTINHPDIIIEPNPVVYHKPAAVIRSPVIYKHLPRKVEYRQVVKHIVKPIERKVVLGEKQHPPHIPIQKPKYYLAQQSNAPHCTHCQLCSQKPTTTNLGYQPEVIADSDYAENGSQYSPPMDFQPIYYKHSFPSSYSH